jgi:hypothetical protein
MVNELYHHGVKGMRWGIRRAEKKRSKYINKYKRITAANQHVADMTRKDIEDFKRNGKDSLAWQIAKSDEWTSTKKWMAFSISELKDEDEVVKRGKQKIKELESLDLTNKLDRKKLKTYKKTPIWK